MTYPPPRIRQTSRPGAATSGGGQWLPVKMHTLFAMLTPWDIGSARVALPGMAIIVAQPQP